MTLEQLRIFVCVAERLNMTRAAEALHITQSGVSASIGALENTYGTALFDRVGRRIELSVAGRAFLDEARKILNQVREAQRTLMDMSNLRRGTVTIYASQTIGNYWLPRVIGEFSNRFPHLNIDLHIANTEEAARMVLDGAADIGFVAAPHVDPDLDGVDIEGDQLCVLVRPDHAWAQRPPRPEELVRGGWVLREEGSATRSEFERALRGLGADVKKLDVRLELPTNEAILSAVVAGLGPSALSDLVAREALASGALVRAVNLPRRSFRVLRHAERKLSLAAEMFLKCLPGAEPEAETLPFRRRATA
jgi:DNA-binding transcriptional LysR family regulator